MGKNLLRDQKSCVIIDGSTTTKYFSLEGSAYQGDLFSAFLFGSALEVIYSYKIKAWDWRNDNLCLWCSYNLFLKRYYFYKAYGWYFLYFSGLKPNLIKSENDGIRVLKGVQVAVCGMRCIDLNKDTLKILSTHFSHNKKNWMRKKHFLRL